ncbi:MAG TPA: acetyl-CoA decarbonylase/synthase complex subunit gamma [Bacillota bacterium]|nr:acetyl-CoA decarbonylase/synthase complex subunit gamma [Bacillota bacterium]
MGLTGLEIYKQLPKTNCKDCGYPTCLAFAMAMATGKARLDKCRHMSEAAREALGSAAAPPVAPIRIGDGVNQVELGNETVLFRHDKRFEHQTAIAVAVSDLLDDEEIAARVKKINNLSFDRIGEVCRVNLIAVDNRSQNSGRFAAAVEAACQNTDLPLILISEDPEAVKKALGITAAKKPLVCGANALNCESMAAIARQYEVPLTVKGCDLDELAVLVEKTVSLGWKQLVLDSGAKKINRILADQTQIRRLALKKFRPFGFPTIVFVNSGDGVKAVLDAAVCISKYAGIVVLNSDDRSEILPLVTLRLNIYTDPQKPVAVESKIYEILSPGPDSPVYITTNFSLSYFCVAGDVEASKVPGYILPVDTDGVSVLTGWAAGKFTPEKIAEALKSTGIEKKVSHRAVIIPGSVAVLKEKLQEISGWEVMVGPMDSSGIPSFIRKHWGSHKSGR